MRLCLPMRTLMKALKLGAMLWISVVIAASGVAGMVLCIGEDGHVTLEWSQDGQCKGGDSAARDDTHDTHSHLADGADACCGDCIDIAFPTDSLSKTRGTARRPDSVTLPSLPQAMLAGVQHVPQMPLARPLDRDTFPPGPSDGVRVQRTIMLRI